MDNPPEKECYCGKEDKLREFVRDQKSPYAAMAHLSDRLCCKCANDSDPPIVFRVSKRSALPLLYWDMWKSAGTDMTQTHMGLTLLEFYANGEKADHHCHRRTFRALVEFFLLRHPNIVFSAQLPSHLSEPDRLHVTQQIDKFIRRVCQELELLPRVLVQIIIKYAFGNPLEITF